MIYNFTGKNYKINDRLNWEIQERLEFLKKYFIIDDSTEVHVTISYENGIYKVELMVFSKAGILKSEQRERKLNTALDVAVNKLEKQITRNKDRLNRRRKAALAEAFVEIERAKTKDEMVVRTKSINPLPMELDEAILQMEMLGHSFFIYLDQETDQHAVVYKRDQGGYGLIEIEE